MSVNVSVVPASPMRAPLSEAPAFLAAAGASAAAASATFKQKIGECVTKASIKGFWQHETWLARRCARAQADSLLGNQSESVYSLRHSRSQGLLLAD